MNPRPPGPAAAPRVFRPTIAVAMAAVFLSNTRAADHFTIDATDFDEGNVRVSTVGEAYADEHSCIWNGGELPNRASYEIEYPVGGDYTLFALYAAAQARPVEISLDGKIVRTGFGGTTGGWNTKSAKWEKQCVLRISPGRHTITLERKGAFPHICAIRLKSPTPFPDGWQPMRLTPAERAQRSRQKLASRRIDLINPAAIRRALADLALHFPDKFPDADALRRRADELEKNKMAAAAALRDGREDAADAVDRLLSAQRQLLLPNPLLDFDRLLIVKRGNRSPALGLPQNWQGNCALPRNGFDDEIATLSMRQPDAPLRRVYKPMASVFVGDVDLHFDADRLLFSSISQGNTWEIFEIRTDGSGLRQVTPPGSDADIDNYDACYLPDGGIAFGSTRTFAAVPCVNGSTRVANLFRMDADGSNIRQLCFDQEHNWCPVPMPDGRLLYTRWEYTDTPHAHTRLLFHMNPDGTQQMEFYGSNSYWPNSKFYARPIPGHASRVVMIASGHHGVRRMGELVIVDPARGRHEASGVIQRIPGHGQQVKPLIEDNLVDNSWPKFLHPFPLGDASNPAASGKYFLVACQPSHDSPWGIYLADIFDNIVLLREEPGAALLEPIPLRKTPRPPALPDKTDPKSTTCTVQIIDIYRGPGLVGIPRGTVKSLRLFTYTYVYPNMGGPQGVVGMEGPWDVRRILGTVPVEPDGSAMFVMPANTPVSIQPLDANGSALQLMRSWMTGMPGEHVTCVGCHEPQNQSTPVVATIASKKHPRGITPWRGPARGYSFANEVQPMLDRLCVGCHDGKPRADGASPPDLRGNEFIHDYDSRYHHGREDAGRFSVAYANLQRYVRRPGLESDYHLLTPMEFHSSTTELFQMLEKGHHGVRLDPEAWDRLITWIDLNAPFHGSWLTIAGKQRVESPARRRREMLRAHAGMDVDMEWAGPETRPVSFSAPPQEQPSVTRAGKVAGWPFDAAEARRKQGDAKRHVVQLGDGIELAFVRIPAGEFPPGDAGGPARPASAKVDAFYIGESEITNEQYALFDRGHDSRVEVRHAMQFGVQGWPLNRPRQPVVRVSWERALQFCEWMSRRLGRKVTLPTETQWEWACRAGAATPFYFGGQGADFSGFANLADVKLRDAVSHPYKKENEPLPNPTRYDDWIPRDQCFNDGELVSADVARYRPNAWGLYDMHGNVWEWTMSAAADPADGHGQNNATAKRIVRGGSWRDRPARATASFRLAYPPFQRVYNVGFRVVMDRPDPIPLKTASADGSMHETDVPSR